MKNFIKKNIDVRVVLFVLVAFVIVENFIFIKKNNILKSTNKDISGKILELEKKYSSEKEIYDTLKFVYGTHVDDFNLKWMSSLILSCSYRFVVDWRIIVAKMYVESKFDFFARSSVKTKSIIWKNNKKIEIDEFAYGLMQIKPSTAEEICVKFGLVWTGENMLYSPYYNILFGTYYLSEMERIFGVGAKNVCIAYNIGHGEYNLIIKKKKKMSDSYGHWNKVKNELIRIGYDGVF